MLYRFLHFSVSNQAVEHCIKLLKQDKCKTSYGGGRIAQNENQVQAKQKRSTIFQLGMLHARLLIHSNLFSLQHPHVFAIVTKYQNRTLNTAKNKEDKRHIRIQQAKEKIYTKLQSYANVFTSIQQVLNVTPFDMFKCIQKN